MSSIARRAKEEAWRRTGKASLRLCSALTYSVPSLIPDQRYIGSTEDLKSRLSKHNKGDTAEAMTAKRSVRVPAVSGATAGIDRILETGVPPLPFGRRRNFI